MKNLLLFVLAFCVVTTAFAAAPPVIEKPVKAKVSFDVTFTSETQIFIGKKRVRIADLPDEGNFIEFHIKDGKLLKVVIEKPKPSIDL